MRHSLLALLCLIMLKTAAAEVSPQIVAHRGASFDAPENTVAAFQLAWEQGADAAEMDIAVTSDQQLVAIHDDDTQRTCGTNKVVAKSTLAELRTLDAGSWKHEKYRGEKIPTVAEMLATVPDGKTVVIEIKGDAAVVPLLDKELQVAGLKPTQVMVIAFDAAAVALMKKRRPDIESHWIVSFNKKSSRRPSAQSLIDKAREINADGLHLSAGERLDAEYIAAIRNAGLKLYAWTVNDATMGKFLRDNGLTGITTDRPGWLREQLAK